MIIEDQYISEKILQIGKHYTQNVATRFLRPVFTGIFSDTNLMHNISDLTEQNDRFIAQNQSVSELYTQIFAMADFIALVRKDILPNLHNLTEANTKSASEDKVYRVMAFSSLPMNIKLLAQMLAELYEAVLEYDEARSPRNRMVIKKFSRATSFYQSIGLTEPNTKPDSKVKP